MCSEERQASPLAGLTEAVLACRACQQAGFLQHANPIRPAVLDDARMVLVGQAPGAVTDRKGYHFAGPAGAFLSGWLDRAGFPPNYFREHVYLTSLTRCFPGKSASGNGDRAPSRAEVERCRHFLDWELSALNVPVVLLVGKMAIDALLGKRALVDCVGQVFPIGDRVYLPLPHASGVSRWLNVPEHRALLEKALAELSRLRVVLNL
jgi:uracil-DNA glycosylase